MQNLSGKNYDQEGDFNDSGFSEWEKLFACEFNGDFSSSESNFSQKTVDTLTKDDSVTNARRKITYKEDVNSQKLGMSSKETNTLVGTHYVGYDAYKIGNSTPLPKPSKYFASHRCQSKRENVSSNHCAELVGNLHSKKFKTISNQRGGNLFTENKHEKPCIRENFDRYEIRILNRNSRNKIKNSISQDAHEWELPMPCSQESSRSGSTMPCSQESSQSGSTMPCSQESSRSRSTLPYSQEHSRSEPMISSSQESYRSQKMIISSQESSVSHTMIVSSQESSASHTMIVSSQGSANQEMITSSQETSDNQTMIVSSQGSSGSQKMFVSNKGHCKNVESFFNEKCNVKRNMLSKDHSLIEVHDALRIAKKMKPKQNVANPASRSFKEKGFCRRCKNLNRNRILNIRRKELMIARRENILKNRQKQLAAKEIDILKREKVLERKLTTNYSSTPRKNSALKNNSILHRSCN